MLSWKQVTIIISSMLCVVIIYLLPTPNNQKRLIQVEKNSITDNSSNTNISLQEALKLVQSSDQQMQGIQMLVQIIKDDPNNIEALYYLGNFSIRTGQFDKAIERFEHLVSIQPESPQFWNLLGQSYEFNKDKANAAVAYKNFLKFSTDGKTNQEIELKIEQLNK